MNTVTHLYETFQPTNYSLTLDISKRAERQFSGTVIIIGTSSVENQITLHAKDINLRKAWIKGNEGNTSQTTELAISQTGDEVTLTGLIPADTVEIEIDFDGKITDAMHGLYPCYFEVDGAKKELLATQFESHHAREVFPCVDEPEAKATFDLTLITEPGLVVLSNMPKSASHIDEETGDAENIFATSPRMSTYLLAFVVGELQSKSAKTKSGVEVNVWATKAQSLESLGFPLEVAVGSIEFFDDYFGVPYPLPKADHVALPDFSSGAMENWGLITYREVALLVDSSSSVSMREYVATVIAHETSHQWFGNLVTMKWWDDLWLNESFATIMEYVAVDALYPEWNTWNTFASQETLSALRRDQLAGVQAVKCEVRHPDEISTLFDPSIVYAKGGRLLKMLKSYIGEEAFRKGLQNYFETHAYKNTVGADLWRAFSDSSGKDIEAFMNTWITQPGFPLVSVKTTDSGYNLTQERFVLGATENDDNLWPIPLFSASSAFPAELGVRELSVKTEHSLPLLNEHNDAHFVAQYDEEGWKYILEALESNSLSSVTKLALLHETSLLARGGKTDTAKLLPLLESYRNETSEPVWNIIGMVIGDIKRFVEEDEVSEKHLKALITRICLPLYEKLGFDQAENEPEQDTKLRANILGLLSYAEQREVLDRCLDMYRSTEDLLQLPSEIRGVILVVASKHGSKEDFQRQLNIHSSTANAELRDDLASGLCATKDPEHIRHLLSKLKDTSVVKRQDLFRWYIYLLRNRNGRNETWQWMTANWDWIEETFKGDKSYDDFARYSASVLASREWLETYTSFFDPMIDQTALRRAIEIGKVEIQSRVEWLERDTDSVRATLAQQTL